MSPCRQRAKCLTSLVFTRAPDRGLLPDRMCSIRRQPIPSLLFTQALVLEELKALIGQLDPATKATMKNSLYRISRNAAVRRPSHSAKAIAVGVCGGALDWRSQLHN